MSFIKRFRNNDRGQGLVEYAFILALVSIVAIGALSGVGGKISDTFGSVFGDVAGGSDNPDVTIDESVLPDGTELVENSIIELHYDGKSPAESIKSVFGFKSDVGGGKEEYIYFFVGNYIPQSNDPSVYNLESIRSSGSGSPEQHNISGAYVSDESWEIYSVSDDILGFREVTKDMLEMLPGVDFGDSLKDSGLMLVYSSNKLDKTILSELPKYGIEGEGKNIEPMDLTSLTVDPATVDTGGSVEYIDLGTRASTRSMKYSGRRGDVYVYEFDAMEDILRDRSGHWVEIVDINDVEYHDIHVITGYRPDDIEERLDATINDVNMIVTNHKNEDGSITWKVISSHQLKESKIAPGLR